MLARLTLYLRQELDDLTLMSAWDDVLDSLPLITLDPGIESIAALTLRNAVGFHRRFVLRLRQYPYRLLLLVKSPPHVCCEARQSVARELLSNFCTLDVTSQKNTLSVSLCNISRS
jgi:hypothetical protein